MSYFVVLTLFAIVTPAVPSGSSSLEKVSNPTKYKATSSQCENHLQNLNKTAIELEEHVSHLTLKNIEIEYQLSQLTEKCVCQRECQHKGNLYKDGESWYPEQCVKCICQGSEVHCHRLGASDNCGLQCTEDTCLNDGHCQAGPLNDVISCECKLGFSGPVCEYSYSRCATLQIEGNCTHKNPLWYFNAVINECVSMTSGCFDLKSVFPSYSSCTSACTRGTCCYRSRRQENEENMICVEKNLKDCQLLCYEGELEVVGFYPGTSCLDGQCIVQNAKACHIGTSLHWIGSTFNFGCNTCQCTEEGISCQCGSVSARKEIRELSKSERQRYYKAIEELNSGAPNSVWSSFRDLYVTYIMHANSPHYFLFWHRIFIWNVEKHLQQLDCSITVPYFDFTLDSGLLSKSVVWHHDYFGGKRMYDSRCTTMLNGAPSHIQEHCIHRKLGSDVSVPSMVDIAIALANKNFTEFSSYMQNVAGYLHAFVGGDMETAASPSDPVFYSIHAYIDLLFWRWQVRHGYIGTSTFPIDYPGALLIPFGTTVKHTIDLENSLCMMYDIPLNEEYSPEIAVPNQTPDAEFNAKLPFSSERTECFENEHDVFRTGRQIQEILYMQNKEFLQTLPRLCPSLQNLPHIYENQIWHELPKNMKNLTRFQKVNAESKLQDRFCFTADIFLTNKTSLPASCEDSKVAVCDMSVLSTCPFYPHALCKLSLCGNCTATCHVNGQNVVCGDNSKDFCKPNPCKNNGVCKKSKWPTLPHLVSCQCFPGFEGQYCEDVSSQRCYLPQENGESCGESSQRWYFDILANDCQPFWYKGCFGNANNFQSFYECRVTCIVGACCWRTPLPSESLYGYNEEGYDRYGFTSQGFSRRTEKRTVLDGFGGESAIYRHFNFDYQGYDKNGFNKHGIDRFGYNSRGFHHVTRYNLTGYDNFGDYDGIIDFDEYGYDAEGYNRAGLNCYGYSRDGWDYYGLTTGWKFDCRSMKFKDCMLVETEFPRLYQQVIAFTPGKKCEEVKCEQLCGCDFLDESYDFGTFLTLGCGICECRKDTRIHCPCTTTNVRKEIRDLTPEELQRYQNAIKMLNAEKTSTWKKLSELYQRHIPQSRGGSHFLPWHRFFLRLVEMKLQEVDCAITIPYFDWTMDVGDITLSVAWQANYFGGDGNPKHGDCVQRHPFKNPSSQHWSPCLRRHFNTSIQLPDAIHMEIILREDVYDTFRLQLEALSSLFHLFVGGHMATPDSAYDPVFLSHYAFVDKLWYEWGQLKANGIELYPSDFRFLPLTPFSITPDDVLLSEIQMCVSYLDITDGAPCNRGEGKEDDDWFNQPPFLTPYNYDEDGYDFEGYHLSGFDDLGFNKDGFYTDSFNRDGYNFLGFDHEGFNRYGFDFNGCNSFGFCSFDILSDSKNFTFNTNKTNFNAYGYSDIGLDYHGYDAYGFNVQGYDKHNCSFFFHGPFYPLFMKKAKNQLQQLTKQELGTIERMCQAITKVPDWYLELNWLHRRDQAVTIKAKQEALIAHRPFNTNEMDFIHESFGDWLPTTPDERFCFQLHHHSSCMLTEPPVPCSLQPCDVPMCSTRPTARCREFGCGSCDLTYLDVATRQPVTCNSLDCKSMDGSIHENGDVWSEDLCESCSCQQGNVVCTEMDCEEMVMCQHPMHVPNVCCPVCEGCEYEGQSYANGGKFIDPQNPCFQCMCANGTVHCSPVVCSAMPPCKKSALITLNRECCPICSMCGPHANGSSWMESPCHNCTCSSGHISCSVIECLTPKCLHPWKKSGYCCRSCDGCEYEGLAVQNGELFHPDLCNTCTCENGNVICHTMHCPAPECPNPMRMQGQCCPVCPKECKYEGKIFFDGEIFTPSFDQCMNCSCQSALVRCQPTACPELKPACRSPVTFPETCCPVCPKCLINGSEYDNGHTWVDPIDPCRICICMDGLAVCSKKINCEKVCTHGVIPSGECCSSCVDCMYKSHLVMDHMQFSPPEDPCTRCACRQGSISCTRESCPQLFCRKTELKPFSCCPVCKGCLDSRGAEIMHGHKWGHPSDLCQICTCHEGISRCERITCDSRCNHPVKKPNSCCPECHGCQYHGNIYKNNDEVPSEDLCKTCKCYGGNVECESKRCPRITCLRPISVPGECCPICKECILQGKTYRNGEKFHPPSDPCYNCSCEMGVIQCHKFEQFCNPQCHHPIKINGHCCPLCDGCEFEHTSYRNGQRFIPDANDTCKQCECLNGNVQCTNIQCPQLLCPNPLKSSKECCGECPMFCTEQGDQLTHREGDVWPHPEDRCQTCLCKHSVIKCEKVQCPTVNCSHPAPQFGECCPKCDNCEFTHEFYHNEQEFPHVEDPCLICVCENGNVTCITLTCDPLLCHNPVRVEGHCCPVCLPNMGCHHLDRFYEPWEAFTDPEQPCRECVCADGIVTCHQGLCPNANCPNPVLNHCCDSCDGCSYADRNYLNDVIFEDPYNPCRLCHCVKGVVSCQQQPCPPMMCKNPVMLEECCPVCKDCLYQNIAYENGEVFSDPRDSCLKCRCEYPKVHCQAKNCPEITCSHPVTDMCCKLCLDCMLNNSVYEDGTTFVDPSNSCNQCTCKSGNIYCRQKPCPSATCSHPIQGECCKECQADCWFNQILFKHWQVFLNPHDSCQECICKKGSVTCKPKKCSPIKCKHPSNDQCCPVCADCFYKNEVISNGETVNHDGTDVCRFCHCENGNVKCQPHQCPTVHCTDPIMDGCCPVCHLGCFYNGKAYNFGAEFDHPTDPCSECACMDGSVYCDLKPCEPLNCDNPVDVENQCCLECPTHCLHGGIKKFNGEIFPDIENNCSECKCLEGNIQCSKKLCSSVTCEDPAPGECCLECNDCEYFGKVYPEDSMFNNPEKECEKCACKHGNVVCAAVDCPILTCPVKRLLEGECCPVCVSKCIIENQEYDDGDTFASSTDNCQKCSCLKGQVVCKTEICIHCSHPVLVPNQCCSLCDDCNYNNNVYRNQQHFSPLNDPCEECICKNGTVTCHRLSCSLAVCNHPVLPEGECCPVCPGCVMSGIKFEEGKPFTNPENPCEECICVGDIATCEARSCYWNCTDPIPDPCCPVCDNCLFEANTYKNREQFYPDICRTCTCADGSVHCVSEVCPEFNCSLKTKIPGECCEVCKGCVYEGAEYENGDSWVAAANPCVSCQCEGGTIVCSELHCFVPCSNPKPVPGRCCPVCIECEVSGKLIPSGYVFNPDDNPCDTCTCDSGELVCIKPECPSLVNCPQDAIRPPSIGECCPTCSGFSSSCTREQIGHLVQPSADPCFVCQCAENFMWICSREICPSFFCPEEKILHVEGECCSKCKVCAIKASGEMYENGVSWISTDNVCSNCTCEFGIVKCSESICSNIDCKPEEFIYRPPGECCDICLPSDDLACHYGEMHYNNGQSWNPEPCILCHCSVGRVNCQSQRCVPLNCPSDEIPSVDPGKCCPRCIPRPATCVAFGDPHYRTFDGKIFHFQGTCRYVLAADCTSQQFSVIAENNDRGFKGVSWTERIVLVLQNTTVDLRNGPSVYVKGKFVKILPYFDSPMLYIEKTGSSVLVTTDVGVKVLWNGDSYVEVTVSGTFRGKTCGLCGNFNNYPEDDMKLPSGLIVTSEARFGNSWKNRGAQTSNCVEAVNIEPCSSGGYRARRIANIKCSVLKESLFEDCHSLIAPEPYFASCVYDVCACSENDDCLCDILTAYSQECAKAGVILHWRSAGFCDVSCSEKEGLVFDECGPPCPRTCENRDVPIRVLAEQCFKPCVPGCQCSADKVLYKGHCISVKDCP